MRHEIAVVRIRVADVVVSDVVAHRRQSAHGERSRELNKPARGSSFRRMAGAKDIRLTTFCSFKARAHC